VNLSDTNGMKVGVGATYDGLFNSDFEAWGLTFDLEIPLSKPKAR